MGPHYSTARLACSEGRQVSPVLPLFSTLNIIEEEVRKILPDGRPARLEGQVRHRIRLEFYLKGRHREGRGR